MKQLVVLPLALALGTVALGQEREVEQTPEQIWDASCGYCHSGPMQAPVLHGRQLPQELIISFARNGANGMPPFHESELSDAELRALARWISDSETVPEQRP